MLQRGASLLLQRTGAINHTVAAAAVAAQRCCALPLPLPARPLPHPPARSHRPFSTAQNDQNNAPPSSSSSSSSSYSASDSSAASSSSSPFDSAVSSTPTRPLPFASRLSSDPHSLDDLFGEEIGLEHMDENMDFGLDETSGEVGEGSGLSSVLADASAQTAASSTLGTRRSMRGAAIASAEAARRAQDYSEGMALLDHRNPPKLTSPHLHRIKLALGVLNNKRVNAMRDLGLDAKDPNALQSEAAQSSQVIQTLSQHIEALSELDRAFFPPASEVNESLTASILDIAESMPGVMNVVTPDAVDPLKVMSVDHKTTRQNRHKYCLFCRPTTAALPTNRLEYTNVNLLVRFLNPRGMILPREMTRLCMKHQRKLAQNVKRARNIGLLSPLSNWTVPPEFVYEQRELIGVGSGAGAATGSDNMFGQSDNSSATKSGESDNASFDSVEGFGDGSEFSFDADEHFSMGESDTQDKA